MHYFSLALRTVPCFNKESNIEVVNVTEGGYEHRCTICLETRISEIELIPAKQFRDVENQCFISLCIFPVPPGKAKTSEALSIF